MDRRSLLKAVRRVPAFRPLSATVSPQALHLSQQAQIEQLERWNSFLEDLRHVLLSESQATRKNGARACPTPSAPQGTDCPWPRNAGKENAKEPKKLGPQARQPRTPRKGQERGDEEALRSEEAAREAPRWAREPLQPSCARQRQRSPRSGWSRSKVERFSGFGSLYHSRVNAVSDKANGFFCELGKKPSEEAKGAEAQAAAPAFD
ncbi:unnamed protein product [Symbiodinium sp. CCMP2592]|nr:unnamed protein product [Symbiodinium sp. CCMP2592]